MKTILVSIVWLFFILLTSCSMNPPHENHVAVPYSLIPYAEHRFSEPIQDILEREGNLITSSEPPTLVRKTGEKTTVLRISSGSQINGNSLVKTLPKGLMQRLEADGWIQVSTANGLRVAKMCYLTIDNQYSHALCQAPNNRHIQRTSIIDSHFNNTTALINFAEKEV